MIILTEGKLYNNFNIITLFKNCVFTTLYYILNIETMGKGDKKSKRGKINRGTFGARRPRIKKRVKPETKINVDKKDTVRP